MLVSELRAFIEGKSDEDTVEIVPSYAIQFRAAAPTEAAEAEAVADASPEEKAAE